MLRELVSNNIFVFSSELYAQVTAGAILTTEGAIVIDTLPFPSETRQIVQFIEERHKIPVRYVINTHYHADHTYGSCFFKQAQVVSHRLCRELLNDRGRAGLERARRSNREMAAIQLRLPDVVFDAGEMLLRLGEKTLRLWHSPGHSLDSIVCFVEEEGILFAADTMMPVPFFADGSWTQFTSSLHELKKYSFEAIVQGHGEVILKGEVPERINADLQYLEVVHDLVNEVVTRGGTLEEAHKGANIEACGKSRIALNGLVLQLHRGNVETLYRELTGIIISDPTTNQTGGQG